MANKKFDLGRIVVTKEIEDKMKADNGFKVFIQTSLGKYADGNWGVTKKEDRKANDEALKTGDRIFAVYRRPNTEEKVWIITEAGRSVTTILFPDQY